MGQVGGGKGLVVESVGALGVSSCGRGGRPDCRTHKKMYTYL